MADTAALVVALSAQLTKFEKDMKDAVGIADRQTKQIEDSFSKLNKNIENELSTLASRAASGLGPIGGILSALGPVGVAVAGTIATLGAAFVFLSDQVDKFAERSKALKEAAETAGLGVNQLKALADVGLEVGLSFEQTERFITRLALAVQDLRTNGSGPLFDVLLRLNPELIRQVAAAKDVAQAIDILSRAYSELNKQQQLQLTRAIGGQRGGNLQAGQLLGAVATGGGVQQITDSAKSAGKALDEDLNPQIVKLRNEIEAIKRSTTDIWGRTFAADVLEAEKQTATVWETIAKAVEQARAGNIFFKGPITPLAPTGATFQQRFAPATEAPLSNVEQATRDREAAAAETEKNKRASELELLNRHIAALGGAATQSELLRQKTLELAVATDKDKEVRQDATRGLAAFSLQQQIAAEAARERLGIATEEQIAQGKTNQLTLLSNQIHLTQNEILQATNVILKESKDAADALAVRRSFLPGLTQLALDAANVRKGLDQLAVNSLNTLGDGFADIVLKTKTVSEAFKSMTDSILRDLLRLIFRQTITGPIASALTGAFNPIAGAALGGGRQSGGPVSGGGAYIVGEHGPELFIPQASGHIVPNAVSQGKIAGGTNVEINNYVAADTETKQSRQEGPSGERIIIDIVKKAQARGQLDDVNRGRFGLRPAKVR